MNLHTKQKQAHRHRNKPMVTKGEGVGRIKLGAWDEHIYNTIYKIDNGQGPTV